MFSTKSLTGQDEERVKKVKLDQLLHLSDKGVFGVVHGVDVHTEWSAGDDIHAVASKDAEEILKRQTVVKYLDQVNTFFSLMPMWHSNINSSKTSCPGFEKEVGHMVTEKHLNWKG